VEELKCYILLHLWYLSCDREEINVESCEFLGRSQQCEKATIVSVLSICPYGATRLPLDRFS